MFSYNFYHNCNIDSRPVDILEVKCREHGFFQHVESGSGYYYCVQVTCIPEMEKGIKDCF